MSGRYRWGMATTPTRPADIRLDDRLCLALYTASRAIIGRHRHRLDALGLTYPQYLVMVLLWEEGPTTVKAIGERLRLKTSTLSPLLRRLEEAELVSRHRSAEDERTVVVTPTERGRSLRGEADGIVEEICDATGMPLEDQASLVTVLRDLADTLDEH